MPVVPELNGKAWLDTKTLNTQIQKLPLLPVVSHPSMDGAIFPSRGCVFGARLAFQNYTIGHGIGV
jgi:hypothetical protein